MQSIKPAFLHKYEVETRLPSNLRPTTREYVQLVTCGQLWLHDEDGGHTIRSTISKNPMLHAHFMALCFTETELLLIEFYNVGMSPDQQSGIHCLIICAIQLLTPNNLGGIRRRICSSDI